MAKAPIAGYWAFIGVGDPSYFCWVAAKYIVRGIAIVFLMGLFLKVDAREMPLTNHDVKLNHFLVPTVILTILGTFLESLIDQYVGQLDTLLRFATRS